MQRGVRNRSGPIGPLQIATGVGEPFEHRWGTIDARRIGLAFENGLLKRRKGRAGGKGKGLTLVAAHVVGGVTEGAGDIQVELLPAELGVCRIELDGDARDAEQMVGHPPAPRDAFIDVEQARGVGEPVLGCSYRRVDPPILGVACKIVDRGLAVAAGNRRQSRIPKEGACTGIDGSVAQFCAVSALAQAKHKHRREAVGDAEAIFRVRV